MVDVLLVEDDKDFIFLLMKRLRMDERLNVLGYAQDAEMARELARSLMPDIVIMDLNLSGNALEGIEVAKEIRLITDAKVLLLTSYDQPEIMISASKKAFASGYVLKSQCAALAETIYSTATSITPQEQFIKELLLNDLTQAERGVLTDLLEDKTVVTTPASIKTIANQKTSIFKKLGLKSTGECLKVFRNWG